MLNPKAKPWGQLNKKGNAMKVLASVFIMLTLLAACQPQYGAGRPMAMGMGAGHEGNETAAMEAMEGPGQ